MAKAIFRLDERTIKNGMYQVRMRISANGDSTWIPTGVWVERPCFNPDNLYEPILSSAYMYREKSANLRDFVYRYDQVVLDLERDKSKNFATMSAKEIREYIVCKREPNRKCKKVCNIGRIDFMDWLDKYGNTKEKDKTRKSYQYTWNLLNEYCNSQGIDRLYFDDLEYKLFVDLKEWMQATGRGESARHQLESNMHAAWREACRLRMVDRSDDPWVDYSIERVEPPMDIDFAPIEDIRKALDLNISGVNGEEWLQTTKDLVALSWFFCGANLKDIYYMPKPKNGEFVFVRQKSQTEKKTKRNVHIRPVHIRVEPELNALLAKYTGSDGAFCFRELVPNYDTFQRKVIDRLSRLCQLSGVSFDFRMLRRSWGTYALRETRDRWVVDNSMGHQPDSILLKHYGAYDWEETARCNRKMIDYLYA